MTDGLAQVQIVWAICQVVGVTGLEPATFWSRTKRSTKLSYTPRQEESPFPFDVAGSKDWGREVY
jgi:hypothetical protein